MVLSRCTAYHIICCTPIFLCFASILGVYIFWWVEIGKMNYNERKKCTETTCFVQIIGNDCFAKIADLIDPTLYAVRCDKDRKGSYNITLPCDIKKETNIPILRCVDVTSKSDQIIGSVMSFAFGGTIVIMILFFIYLCLVFESKDSVIKGCEPEFMTNYFDSDKSNKVDMHDNFRASNNFNKNNVGVSKNKSSSSDSSSSSSIDSGSSSSSESSSSVSTVVDTKVENVPAQDTPAVPSTLYPHLTLD